MPNPENKEHKERVPEVKIVDGKEVAQYLTPELKDKFIRYLATENMGGVFDQEYYDQYMAKFERRINNGYITLLLADGEPAALGAVYVNGKIADGRDHIEMGNLVTLPEFKGRRYASQLMEYRFQKARTQHPDSPISTTTHQPEVAGKCLRMGMNEYPLDKVYRLRWPKDVFIAERTICRATGKAASDIFPELSGGAVTSQSEPSLDEVYENELNAWVEDKEKEHYKIFWFDPKEQHNETGE